MTSGAAASGHSASWTPPIARCVAVRGEGIDTLVGHLDAHRTWVETSEAGRARKEARLREEVREGLREALIEAATRALHAEIEAATHRVAERTSDPYTETEALLEAFRGGLA